MFLAQQPKGDRKKTEKKPLCKKLNMNPFLRATMQQKHQLTFPVKKSMIIIETKEKNMIILILPALLLLLL